ncbi:MAG: patatin-like phospholipase family protein [Bacillota bacterium]|nr:patatin-like phospholipase family protein [Bacillota bacterium]
MTEIGLALGGGAARGLAHLGVLRELEEAGIRISCLAGCSFGSLIAAAYACGTLAEVEDFFLHLNRTDLVHYCDLVFSGGVVGGQVLLAELRRLTRGLHFEDLPRPFAVVATDLETKSRVVLHRGSIAEAVRASMSVPGLLTPATVEGRTLVDGGLVEIVPVGTARLLGASRVAAVDVSSHRDVWTRAATRARRSVRGLQRECRRVATAARWLWPLPLPEPETTFPESGRPGWGMVRTVLTAFDITEARLRSTGPEQSADIIIRPRVEQVHGHQFYRAAELVAAGRAAARDSLPLLLVENHGRLARLG